MESFYTSLYIEVFGIVPKLAQSLLEAPPPPNVVFLLSGKVSGRFHGRDLKKRRGNGSICGHLDFSRKKISRYDIRGSIFSFLSTSR